MRPYLVLLRSGRRWWVGKLSPRLRNGATVPDGFVDTFEVDGRPCRLEYIEKDWAKYLDEAEQALRQFTLLHPKVTQARKYHRGLDQAFMKGDFVQFFTVLELLKSLDREESGAA